MTERSERPPERRGAERDDVSGASVRPSGGERSVMTERSESARAAGSGAGVMTERRARPPSGGERAAVTLHVELVSPEPILFSGDAQMVICRTTLSRARSPSSPGTPPSSGRSGPARSPSASPTAPTEKAAVHGGFVEVSHDRVTILSDVAEMAHQIDLLLGPSRPREVASNGCSTSNRTAPPRPRCVGRTCASNWLRSLTTRTG